MDIVKAARAFHSRTAVKSNDRQYSYRVLLAAAKQLCGQIANVNPNDEGQKTAKRPRRSARAQGDAKPNICEARVALMSGPGAEYVVGTWATWMAGGITVPLALSHPPKELEYVLDDAGVSVILATPEYEATLRPLAEARGVDIIVLQPPEDGASEDMGDAPGPHEPRNGALIIYTSGTTGRPKGALHTHGSLIAQVKCLTTAWKWSKDDTIVHPLPLHHIHGIVNALYCAHYVGACVEFLPRFSPSLIWDRLQNDKPPVTVFMGVPTMYHRLIQAYDALGTDAAREKAKEASKRLRLTISGSAACPVPIVERWREISGSTLLERYGMTEIGMALSNPYDGARKPGFVGQPLPGVEAKIVPIEAGGHAAGDDGGGDDDDDDDAVPVRTGALASSEDGPGELRIKGANLFREYWGRPEATAESFDEDGFFKTGDTVIREGGSFKILGRTSVDILKSGGYKLSALEIEDHLLEHPKIAEVAVVGLDDVAYGQKVACVVSPGPLTASELADWCKGRLAPYKVPREVKVVTKIDRNAMGKVNKKDIVRRWDTL